MKTGFAYDKIRNYNTMHGEPRIFNAFEGYVTDEPPVDASKRINNIHF